MRKTLLWLNLVVVVLLGAACGRGTSTPTAPAAQIAESTPAIAVATTTPTATVAPTPSPVATKAPATPKPKPAATEMPTADPNATWVSLSRVDQDLTDGLLRETDLDKSWTKLEAVQRNWEIPLNQVVCDGKLMQLPVAPGRSADVEFDHDASSLPEPFLIQVNWAMPSQSAAEDDMSFIKDAARCSNWSISGTFGSISIRPYSLTEIGDESASAQLNITYKGSTYVLTTVFFRSGSVISGVTYVDSKAADPAEFKTLATKAAARVASLNL